MAQQNWRWILRCRNISKRNEQIPLMNIRMFLSIVCYYTFHVEKTYIIEIFHCDRRNHNFFSSTCRFHLSNILRTIILFGCYWFLIPFVSLTYFWIILCQLIRLLSANCLVSSKWKDCVTKTFVNLIVLRKYATHVSTNTIVRYFHFVGVKLVLTIIVHNKGKMIHLNR